jgi:hypothetical protein
MKRNLFLSLLFAAAPLAAFAALAQSGEPDPRTAVVLAIEGKAYWAGSGDQKTPLKRGAVLSEGASVRTDRARGSTGSLSGGVASP